MAKRRDWDKARIEDRTRKNGWQGVDAEHSGGDGPLGTKRDEPYWPSVPGGKPGDLYRSKTGRLNEKGEFQEPVLVMLFNSFVSDSKDDSILEKCTNAELDECRNVCGSLLNRFSGLTWASGEERKRPFSNTVQAPKGKKGSALMELLRVIAFISEIRSQFEACTDAELCEFKEICQTTGKRAALEILKRRSAKSA
jgi:hypothetical protein